MEKENLPARASETGNYAMTKLRALQKHHALIGEVRGLGLMIGVELVKDEKLTPATAEAEAIRDALLRNGVLVGVGGIYANVIRFQPPLIITRQQIDQAVDAFAAAFQGRKYEESHLFTWEPLMHILLHRNEHLDSPGLAMLSLHAKADGITVSAPCERVDLEALKATKARRKGAER
jgi:hypothetical protein